MENLQPYYDLVESVIESFGINATECRGEKSGMWKMYKGSAEVWIDVWYIEKEQRSYFQVMAPVMPVPAQNREGFYLELLELSDGMYDVAFSMHKGWAYIKNIREAAGIDFTEIRSTINFIGCYCDEHDDRLKAKYGPPQAPGAPPTK